MTTYPDDTIRFVTSHGYRDFHLLDLYHPPTWPPPETIHPTDLERWGIEPDFIGGWRHAWTRFYCNPQTDSERARSSRRRVANYEADVA
jgi:hypothetical protein